MDYKENKSNKVQLQIALENNNIKETFCNKIKEKKKNFYIYNNLKKFKKSNLE